MPQTKRGIFHNLKESKYTISNNEIVFFFSSKLYMDKFLDNYKMFREQFTKKIAKYDTPLNMEILADILFYKSIEKRGFRAWIKGVDITWEELNLYALRKMTEKNTNEWSKMQKPKFEERLKIMA